MSVMFSTNSVGRRAQAQQCAYARAELNGSGTDCDEGAASEEGSLDSAMRDYMSNCGASECDPDSGCNLGAVAQNDASPMLACVLHNSCWAAGDVESSAGQCASACRGMNAAATRFCQQPHIDQLWTIDQAPGGMADGSSDSEQDETDDEDVIIVGQGRVASIPLARVDLVSGSEPSAPCSPPGEWPVGGVRLQQAPQHAPHRRKGGKGAEKAAAPALTKKQRKKQRQEVLRAQRAAPHPFDAQRIAARMRVLREESDAQNPVKVKVLAPEKPSTAASQGMLSWVQRAAVVCGLEAECKRKTTYVVLSRRGPASALGQDACEQLASMVASAAPLQAQDASDAEMQSTQSAAVRKTGIQRARDRQKQRAAPPTSKYTAHAPTFVSVGTLGEVQQPDPAAIAAAARAGSPAGAQSNSDMADDGGAASEAAMSGLCINENVQETECPFDSENAACEDIDDTPLFDVLPGFSLAQTSAVNPLSAQELRRDAVLAALGPQQAIKMDAAFAQQYVPGRMPNDTSKVSKAARKKAAKEARRAAVRRTDAGSTGVGFDIKGQMCHTACPPAAAAQVPAPVAAHAEGAHWEFGQFEQHTKGIGSRLLAQMGYQDGQGLGAQRQGRVNPILPAHRGKRIGLGM